MGMKKLHRDRKGFTLMETLIVVAIVVILLGLAIVGVSSLRKKLRQEELDAKAEMIYAAAQNSMAQLDASGQQNLYTSGITPLDMIPLDADMEENKIDESTLYYVTSDRKEDSTSAAYYIVRKDRISVEMWQQDWVVEFDPISGSVYAVYYSESDMSYAPQDYDYLRLRQNRLRDGAKVGYYGGDVHNIEITDQLSPKIDIVNGEKLIVNLNCLTPDGKGLSFYLTVADSYGNKVTQKIKADKEAWKYSAQVVLDSLDPSEKRFKNNYPDLKPGANLTLTLRVVSDSPLVDECSVTARTNSLFAQLEGNTAVIVYGRHLQNLDELSGVMSTITKAEQRSDLRFDDDEHDTTDWYSYYGSNSFKPVDNENLTSYTGRYTFEGEPIQTTIYGLSVRNGWTNGGMFDTFYGGRLSNVWMSGAKVTSMAFSGGLAGSVKGETQISNCRIFHSLDRGELNHKTHTDPWITGDGCVGGLVGTTTDSSQVTIRDSFAATVAEGGTYAGGLIGFVRGDVIVERSYSDCYLAADTTGGIAGCMGGVGTLHLRNSYTAGYQTARANAAGFVAGTVTDMKSSYSACSYLEQEGYSPRIYSTAAQCSSSNNVYYMNSGISVNALHLSNTEGKSYEYMSDTKEAGFLAQLGTAFTVQAGSGTVAYNLMDQGLQAYSYPKLTNLPHYGDWQAQFESGEIVYYEVYKESNGTYSYGFYGANKSLLQNGKTIVGDGYALAYNGSPDKNEVKITYETGQGITKSVNVRLNATSMINITAPDGESFLLCTLPKEVTDVAYGSSTFYHKIVVDDDTIYYYNPHFARTVVKSAIEPENVTTLIYVRTPRQLYDMSLYYEAYAVKTKDSIFQQEQDMDYDTYQWSVYTRQSQKPAVQKPIGEDVTTPFRAVYDGTGHKIENISFCSAKLYVGMFGYNGGTIRNVSIVSDYTGTNDESVAYTGNTSGSKNSIYMGTMAGYNDGRISNCAVAGYTMELYTYSRSKAWLGGLTGGNSGTILQCSANAPAIQFSATSATAYAGGLTGTNVGTVMRSYAVNNIKVLRSRSSVIQIAGFAGNNGGYINGSYCATSLISSDEAIAYGFTSKGGSVIDCYYLNDGTYNYLKEFHSYNNSQGDNRAKGKNRISLKEQILSGYGGATVSGYHSQTTEDIYPFPAVVTNSDGAVVHYGNWPVDGELSALGLFYWELEQGGSNDGYHVHYIGTDSDGKNEEGSSLCQEHSDNGVITNYGYGWYTEETKGTGADISIAVSSDVELGKEDAAISKAIEGQIEGYDFHAYVTGNTGDGTLYLKTENANGVWQIHDKTNRKVHQFTINPFFADSMSYDGFANVSSATGSYMSGLSLEGAPEGQYVPGSENNTYEIRSVKQLQYINWNYGSLNATELVTASNYKKFPYLQYTANTGSAYQNHSNIGHQVRYWKQSHDVEETTDAIFTPIAGAATSSNNNSYNAILYTWFGNKYDGQSYTIKNINISSKSFSVGLFGATVGADLANIILYSDGNAQIRRDTEPSDPVGAYVIGGLVGTAYDYIKDNSYMQSSARGQITNCSVAGYTIVDNSRNQQGLGEGNVGGLIGTACVNLNNCSAITDILVTSTHTGNPALYGNYIRIGGVIGACRGSMINCYSGGSIKVQGDILNETKDSDGKIIPVTTAEKADKRKSTHVFVSGISGSGFSSNYQNFVGNASSGDDGEAKYTNCYTYMNLPRIEGTIRGVAAISSRADRYGQGNSKLQIINCYYLDSVVPTLADAQFPQYFFRDKYHKLTVYLPNEAEYDEMIKGSTLYLAKYYGDGINDRNSGGEVIRTSYEELEADDMPAKLGNQWSKVTIVENGNAIDGKYSFPGGDMALEGTNYPFPTVVKQTDIFGKVVDVHYGRWPYGAVQWERNETDLDLLRDYDALTGISSIRMKLYITQQPSDNVTPSFTIYDEDGQVVTDAVDASAVWNEAENCFDVTLQGSKVGDYKVAATYIEATEYLHLTVTEELVVQAKENQVKMLIGEERYVLVKATSKTRADGSVWDLTGEKDIQWKARSEDEDIIEVLDDKCQIVYVDETDSNGNTVQSPYYQICLRAYSYNQAKITVEARYPFGESVCTGKDDIYVEAIDLGKLGLSNGTKYNQIDLNVTNSDNRYTGSDETPDRNVVCTADVFLYVSNKERDIGQFDISAIDVISNGTTYTVLDDSGWHDVRYSVAVGDSISDNYYDYRPIVVRGPVYNEEVELQMTLNRQGSTYKLKVKVTVKDLVVMVAYEDPSGAIDAGSMTTKAPVGSVVTIPQVDGNRAGYVLAGWDSNGDGVADLVAGDTVTIISEMAPTLKLTAIWKAAVPYTIVFEGNVPEPDNSYWNPYRLENNNMKNISITSNTKELVIQKNIQCIYIHSTNVPLLGWAYLEKDADKEKADLKANSDGTVVLDSKAISELISHADTDNKITLYAVWNASSVK